MDTFRKNLDAILGIWNQATPAARFGIGMLLAVCLAGIIGVGYWSAQPNYVTLVTEATPQQMDKLIDGLDKAGIDYKLSGAGGNLSVDKRNFSKARMIARGQGVEAADSVLEASGAFSSPAERRNAAIAKKERSLESTIQKFNVIDQADVHLNVPDKGPFERKTSKPTASVMLTLLPDTNLDDQQAASIASLVAFAVEDLEPEAVRITDKEGRNYSIPDKQIQHINNQIEYTLENERKLARKAEQQLVRFLGFGNASVQVSLNLTFTQGSKVETKYDKDGKVVYEEDINLEQSNKPKVTAAGPAGTASNLQSTNQASTKAELANKTESTKSSYLVPKTEITETNTTPLRNFMTVSVLVNSAAEAIKQANEGGGGANLAAQVEAIVRTAVGFQENTDKISVEFFEFPAIDAVEEVEPPFDWGPIYEIVRQASLGIAAVIALLIGFLYLRKLNPKSPEAEDAAEDETVGAAAGQNFNQITSLAASNPELFARLVEGFAGQIDEEEMAVEPSEAA